MQKIVRVVDDDVVSLSNGLLPFDRSQVSPPSQKAHCFTFTFLYNLLFISVDLDREGYIWVLFWGKTNNTCIHKKKKWVCIRKIKSQSENKESIVCTFTFSSCLTGTAAVGLMACFKCIACSASWIWDLRDHTRAVESYSVSEYSKATQLKQKRKHSGQTFRTTILGCSCPFISFHLPAISLRLDAGMACAWPAFSVYTVKPRSGSCPAPWRNKPTPCFPQIFRGGSVRYALNIQDTVLREAGIWYALIQTHSHQKDYNTGRSLAH